MKTTRRQFLTKTSAAFAGVQFLPSHVWADSPNGKLNLVHVGCGGMGGSDRGALRSHPKVNVIGLCDVDSGQLAGAKKQSPGAETFDDYRELFAKLGDKMDAACVSTPDHTHAPASMLALNLGKHVYCQKPLTHDVYEARQVRLVAAEKGVATQMGIQIHSSNEYRTATQLVQGGVIGKVHTVHAWSNKNWGYDGPAFEGEDPVPDALNWDTWIGTAAMRPYKNRVYHRGQWRKLIDFGTGTLGDMGVHIFDTPFRALALTAPLTVKTSCRPPTGVGHPTKNIVPLRVPRHRVHHRQAGLELVRRRLRPTEGCETWGQDQAAGPGLAVHRREGADAAAARRQPAVLRQRWQLPEGQAARPRAHQPLSPVGRRGAGRGEGQRQFRLRRAPHRVAPPRLRRQPLPGPGAEMGRGRRWR